MANKPLMFAGAVKRIIQGNQRMGFSKQCVEQETGPATRLQALLTVGGGDVKKPALKCEQKPSLCSRLRLCFPAGCTQMFFSVKLKATSSNGLNSQCIGLRREQHLSIDANVCVASK